MELDKSSVANQRIGNAAQQAAAPDRLSVPVLERFLRTGDETWDGAGSGRFTPAQFENNTAYRRAAKEALRTLFHLLADLLPAEAKQAPQVAPELIRGQVEPMVKGLVQKDWQEVALRELVSRTFVLNYRGAKSALEVELPSGVIPKGRLKPATVHQELRVLRRMMNVAVRKKLLPANPCAGVEFPVKVKGLFRPHYVGWSEQQRIEFQAPEYLRNVIRIITESGLRVYKELMPMKKEQVDLEKAVVWIPDSKTPNGIAEVPLTDLAVDAFREQIRIAGPGPWLFPSDENPTGHQKTLKTVWHATLRRAKVSYFRIYDLRSTYATRLSAGGVADEWVTQLLRQGDAKVFKKYSQMKLQMKREALQANESRTGFDTEKVK